MLTKSLGIEINAMINQVLMKKDEVMNLINKIIDESNDSIKSIDNTIKRMKDTVNQLDLTLNLIETELFNLETRAEKFNSMDLFYNEILPNIKNKYIVILEEYFKLLFSFEEIIENKLDENINKLDNENKVVRNVNYNVYNYEEMKSKSDSEYNKSFFHTESIGFDWHAGKFQDEYMAKEKRGSLSIFHVKESKNERFIDFFSGNSNTIYENIVFHPDYGMLHYISTGSSQNNTGFLNPESPVTDYHHLIKVNDDFIGEFTEAKNIPFTVYGDFLTNSGITANVSPFKFYMALSHIASNSLDKIKYLKDGTYEVKYFIHKIRALEPRDLETPNYFYIGQNKEEDGDFYTQYLNNANQSPESERYLTPYREKIKGSNYNTVISKDFQLIKADTEEFLNNDKSIISKSGLFNGIKASQFFINFRLNKFTKLAHIVAKDPGSNNLVLNKYVYNSDFDSNGTTTTLAYTVKNHSKKNNFYDLFDNLIFRIMPGHVQNQNKNLPPSQGWISMHCVSPIKIGTLQSCSMFDIIQNPFNGRFAGSFIQNNLKNALITASPRNDTYFYGHSFITKYEQALYSRNLTEVNFNKELNFNYNYYEYFNLENDAMRNNKIWFLSLIDNKYYINSTYNFITTFNKSRSSTDLFSVLTGSSNELNDGTDINEQFIYDLKTALKKDLKTESDKVPLGNIITLPFSQDNPKFLYDDENIYARAGTVLNINEFEEFYKSTLNKYSVDIEIEEDYDVRKQFIVPDFRDKYFIGTSDETEVLQTVKQCLPNMKLELEYDSDIDEENSLYNGIISDTSGSSSLAVLGGSTGVGLSKSSIKISHNSQSSKTKGNDLRVDVYIKVK